MNLPITLKSIVVQVQIGDTVYPLTLDAASAAIRVPAFAGTTSFTGTYESLLLGKADPGEPRQHYTHGLPSWYMEDCMKPKTFGQLAKAKKKKARKK